MFCEQIHTHATFDWSSASDTVLYSAWLLVRGWMNNVPVGMLLEMHVDVLNVQDVTDML